MERWNGTYAVVTGVSAGIGAAIAENFIKLGINTFYYRWLESLESWRTCKNFIIKLYPVECDLGEPKEIIATFKWIDDNIGPISILVNNAALLIPSTLTDCETPSRIKKFYFSCHNTNNLNGTVLLSDGTIEDWKAMLDVNVVALIVCTQEAIKAMEKHGIDGHVININALPTGQISKQLEFSIYPATKHAVCAVAETFRMELAAKESGIKLSNVTPAFVSVEQTKSFDSTTSEGPPELYPENVANAVLFVLATPSHVEVCDMVMRVVEEKYY